MLWCAAIARRSLVPITWPLMNERYAAYTRLYPALRAILGSTKASAERGEAERNAHV